MKSLLLSVAFAGVLAACGQTAVAPADTPGPAIPAEQPSLPTIPTDASAGPSGTDNMTWTFDRMGRTREGVARPRLMYHSGGSEGMFLNLQCDAGTNRGFVVSMRDGVADSWRFTVQSGTTRTQLTATRIEPGTGGGEIAASAPVALDAPALAAFRGSGDLTLTEDGRDFVMDAINDQERQTVSSFFEACS